MDKTQNVDQKSVAINVNLDTTPILFTDNIFMTTNPDGLVLDIGQRLASTNQMRIVARVGMSREHAKRFVTELNKLLLVTEGQVQTGSKNRN